MTIITIVIWMISTIKYDNRFQDSFYTIFQIKELMCIVENKFKKHMDDIVFYILVLKFLNIG